jgi:hypothetical protein
MTEAVTTTTDDHEKMNSNTNEDSNGNDNGMLSAMKKSFSRMHDILRDDFTL